MSKCRYVLFLLIFCFVFLPTFSQVRFRTIVPQHNINKGESFQVQYVIENAPAFSNFSPPAFAGFRVVAGPNVYSGGQSNTRKNLVFTLAATGEGKIKIPGATCFVNGHLLTSNDVFVKVVGINQPDESVYFLKPGDDPYKKIRENLFLKLIVDKQKCLVGEPIVATFKLYSRLQSRSNVIKNPGFYGFSVYDIVEINDNVESEEEINGHSFEVHTLRKLQLYPLEAGSFTIDPMELSNQVEFSMNQRSGKPKQSVTENMYNDTTSTKNDEGSKTYDVNMRTEPVVINVQPLPPKNRSDTFTGAVGIFSINAFVERDSILRNEEDSFIVEINGAGNLQRVTAPVITFPPGIEIFEPSISDTFDKQQVPLSGQRRFKCAFVGNRPGFFTIPPVSFTYFDLKTKSYKTKSTKPITIFISARSKQYERPVIASVLRPTSHNWKWLFIAAGLFVLIAVTLLWAIASRKRKIKEQKEVEESTEPIPSALEILMPARSAMAGSDKVFCDTLDRCIWNYFHVRLHFNGQMIKNELHQVLEAKGIETEKINRLIGIMRQCETGIYTNAMLDFNKTELFDETYRILASIEHSLSKEEKN